MKKIAFGLFVFAMLAAMAQGPYKVVLIVQNHAAPGSGIPMMALTDALTAKLSGRRRRRFPQWSLPANFAQTVP